MSDNNNGGGTRQSPLGPGPGVRNRVTACRQCAKPVRIAELIDGSTGLVDAAPLTFVLPDGGGIVLFQPHDQTCTNPLAIELPDGRRKIVT